MAIRGLLLTTLLAASALAAFTGDHTPPNAPRTPVVVELFTSEGCSSCPPADALLIELDQRQDVAEAEVIALGEHVDYWNYLGWRDRFSAAQFSRRQDAYSARFGLDSVYTPQMVVDGRYQLVGNDADGVRRAIAQAAHAAKSARVTLERAASTALAVQVDNAGPGSPEVLLAITESGLSTSVARGENEGRVLWHTAVIRELRVLGRAKEGRFSARETISFNAEWRRKNLKAVALVQDPASRRILGVAAIPLR